MRAATGKKAQAAAALQEALAAAEEKVRPPSRPPSVDGPRATLIVCPLSVLSNWQTQLEEHTAGNLRVRFRRSGLVLTYARCRTTWFPPSQERGRFCSTEQWPQFGRQVGDS